MHTPDRKPQVDAEISAIRKGIIEVAEKCVLDITEQKYLKTNKKLLDYPSDLMAYIADNLFHSHFNNKSGAYMARKYFVLYMPEEFHKAGNVGAVAAEALITAHNLR